MCRCIHLVLVEIIEFCVGQSHTVGPVAKATGICFEEEKRIVNNHLYFMPLDFFSCLVLRRRDIVGYHRHRHNNKKEIP